MKLCVVNVRERGLYNQGGDGGGAAEKQMKRRGSEASPGEIYEQDSGGWLREARHEQKTTLRCVCNRSRRRHAASGAPMPGFMLRRRLNKLQHFAAG
ncbi:hypothetical protein E2C01_095369 [Portunus trituberculatus]|uniref:Uncharacterized protein n=1 Tax=Portunus trituberculatus TaxID=210409 RepID=A0A5B7JV28_PORTR|nr:hypothetical protein [Portunus trituberculatus]